MVDTVAEFTEAVSGLLNGEDTRLKLEAAEPGKLECYTWALSAERRIAAYRYPIRRRRWRNG